MHIEAADYDAPDQQPVIARQAIVDADRAVFGYELFNRARASDAHTPASDAALLFNALSHAGDDGLFGDATVFLNCTHDTLSVGHLDLIHPDRVVLEVPPLPGHFSPEMSAHTRTLADLQRRGFRFAFDHTVLTPAYASWLPMASFIKLDLVALEHDVFERFACAAQTYSTAQLIAEKVETAQQFDQVVAYGIELFQGYWLGTPKLVKTRRMAANHASVVQLINLVRRDASTSEFDDLFKRDVVLGYNLLHLLQASGFGLGTEIRSYGQAVRILGPKRLFQWGTLMLTATRSRGTTAASGSLASVRGRLVELLAHEMLPPEDHDNAFMVGSFSLLGDVLGEPLAATVQQLPLPTAVRDALLGRQGLYAPLLELAEACEGSDDAAFDHAAEALHLQRRTVHEAHLQALKWANDGPV